MVRPYANEWPFNTARPRMKKIFFIMAIAVFFIPAFSRATIVMVQPLEGGVKFGTSFGLGTPSRQTTTDNMYMRIRVASSTSGFPTIKLNNTGFAIHDSYNAYTGAPVGTNDCAGLTNDYCIIRWDIGNWSATTTYSLTNGTPIWLGADGNDLFISFAASDRLEDLLLNASITITYPPDLGILSNDFPAWNIRYNLSSSTYGSAIIYYGQTPTEVYDHTGFVDIPAGLDPNAILYQQNSTAAILKKNSLSVGNWFAQALLLDDNNNLIASSSVIMFSVENTGLLTTTSTFSQIAAAKQALKTRFSITTSTCSDAGLFASSGFSNVVCQAKNGAIEFLNTITGAVVDLISFFGDLITSLFPIHVMYHIYNDVVAAQANSTTTPDLWIPLPSSGNTPKWFTIAGSSTAAQIQSDYGFDYKGLLDYVIWLFVLLIMGGETWGVIHHIKKEGQGANIK